MSEFIVEFGWLVLAVFGIIYELIARYKPTQSNISLLDMIHSILNLIIPNNQKDLNGRKNSSGKHKQY